MAQNAIILKRPDRLILSSSSSKASFTSDPSPLILSSSSSKASFTSDPSLTDTLPPYPSLALLSSQNMVLWPQFQWPILFPAATVPRDAPNTASVFVRRITGLLLFVIAIFPFAVALPVYRSQKSHIRVSFWTQTWLGCFSVCCESSFWCWAIIYVTHKKLMHARNAWWFRCLDLTAQSRLIGLCGILLGVGISTNALVLLGPRDHPDSL